MTVLLANCLPHFLYRYTLAALMALLLAFFGTVPAPAASLEDLRLRPRCVTEQMPYGLCLNPNIPEALRFMESPAYQAQVQAVVAAASAYLATQAPGPKQLVIADLDETLLDNRGYYQRYGQFSPDTWQDWVNSHREGPFIPDVLALLQDAKARGFTVMFITGRGTELAVPTLDQVDVLSWDGVFFKPGNLGPGSTMYKANVREMLQQLGYTIVLNIGDQPSDFDLPIVPADGEFLLPNVLYSIP